MPLIPEKRASRQSSRNAINSQFWEQPVHSARSIDGLSWSLPCEPPTLDLTGPSGLSRTQQLIASQALRVPFFPSYDASSGGLVLDRVMARLGGKQWWTAIGTRIKAQRIGTAIKHSSTTTTTTTTTTTPGGTASILQPIKDLSNYSLCARSRFQLNPRLTWNTVIEAPDINILYQQLGEHHRTKAASSSSSSSSSPSPSLLHNNTHQQQQQLGYKSIIKDTCRIHSTVRLNLPGHDVVATLGNNLEYLDSSGEYAHVPVVASLDLSSQERGDGLQYRVGLHQVAAPAFEDWGQQDDVDGGDGDDGSRGARRRRNRNNVGRPLRTSLHAQGAVAVEGEAYIWKSNGGSSSSSSGSILSPSSSPTTSNNTSSLFSRQTSSGEGPNNRKASTIEEAAERGSKVATAITSATAAVGGDYEDEESIHSPGTDLLPTITEEEEDDNGGSSSSEPSSSNLQTSLDTFIHSLDATNNNNKSDDENASSPSSSNNNNSSTAIVPYRQPIIQMTADEISAAIRNSAALLSELKESVVRLTDSVQDGSLQRLSDQLGGRVAAKKRPKSLLLGPSFIKLNAAMGCLARMPLPAVSGVLGFPAPLGSGGGGEDDDGSGDNVMIMAGGGGGGGLRNRNASTASLASLSSQIAEAWEPYLKGTALRIFASAAVSGQFGRFARNFLDFSAFSLRADVGLTSPHVVGVALNPAALAASSYSTSENQTRPDRHRAFALEGRGSWHSLSVSLAQQVVGPVRARCDLRFALDPTNVPEDEGQRSTLRGLAQTALSVRPCLLETVWGLDSVLPGTGGGARVAVWWAPKRREAMAELRLF